MSRLKKAIVASAIKKINTTEDSASQSFTFAEDFVGFEGHFPGRPVLPAIAQMLTALVVAEGLENSPLELKEVPKAKFLNVLEPNKKIQVNCTRASSKQHLRFKVEISSEDKVAANFILVTALKA